LYISNKWENPDIPHSGWECINIQDFGEPVMTCLMCGRETIRYVHYMRHPDYPVTLEVGCICAGKMEGNLQNAKERDSLLKSRLNKRKNWLNRNWKISNNGNKYIESDNHIIVLKQIDGFWKALVRAKTGGFNKWCDKKCKNENEAKLVAFDFLTGILAEKLLKKNHIYEIPVSRQEKQTEHSLEILTLPQETQTEQSFEVLPPLQETSVETGVVSVEIDIQTEVELVPEPIIVTKKKYSKDMQYDLFEQSDTELKFTYEQNNIFEFIRNGTGHGVIDAVAGAGKTTTIIECAKYVPDKANVLFCAFNKSIQSEISAKFQKQGMNQVTVKTIHALGLHILNDNNSSEKKIVSQESKYWTILNKDIEVQNEIRFYLEEYLSIKGYEVNEKENYKQFAIKDIIHKFRERLLDMKQKTWQIQAKSRCILKPKQNI